MRSKLKSEKKMGAKKTAPNLYTRSVRLSAKAGEGSGEKEKEKEKKTRAWTTFLFLQLSIMGVIFNSCSASWRIICGFDSIMLFTLIYYPLYSIPSRFDILPSFLSTFLHPHAHPLSLSNFNSRVPSWDT